jgi:hypothetical protein
MPTCVAMVTPNVQPVMVVKTFHAEHIVHGVNPVPLKVTHVQSHLVRPALAERRQLVDVGKT